MRENCYFALSGGKQNDYLIYLLIECLYRERESPGDKQFAHLLWDKTSGTYRLFDRVAEGVELPKDTRMNDTCLLALVSYAERDRYVKPELLGEESAKRYRKMKPGDNPMIVRYYFRKNTEE